MILFDFDLMERIALHKIRQEIEQINTGFLFCVAFDFEHSWAFVVTSSLAEVDFFLYSDNNIYVKVSVPLSNLNCIRHTFLVPGIFKSDILGTWTVDFYNMQLTQFKKKSYILWRFMTFLCLRSERKGKYLDEVIRRNKLVSFVSR